MSVLLGDVVAHAESLWPSAGAEDWDSVGLVVGSRSSAVAKILFVVDVTAETVDEAVDGDYDLVVAHHPLLLRGVNSVDEDTSKGHLVARLIRAQCALMTVHTNGDRVDSGTSAVLASTVGIHGGVPIVPNPLGGGLGIVGLIPPISLGVLAQKLASALPATAGGIRVSGDFDQAVERVSVCAGAGDSLLSADQVVGSDVYITSDLRHHPASEFREHAKLSNGAGLIDISHWAAEWLWLETAASELASKCPDVTINVSDINTDPWNFVVVQ